VQVGFIDVFISIALLARQGSWSSKTLSPAKLLVQSSKAAGPVQQRSCSSKAIGSAKLLVQQSSWSSKAIGPAKLLQ
jgi:hypothetical protein